MVDVATIALTLPEQQLALADLTITNYHEFDADELLVHFCVH